MSENWQTYPIRKLAANAPQSFTDGDWVEAPHIRETGIRLIQTGNIGIGTFINRSQKYISQTSFDALHCKEIHPGDLLICRLAEPIGRACFAPDFGERMITSVDVTILRVDTESFDPHFVSICINTLECLRQCETVSGGSTRQRISRTNLGKVEIKVPNIDVQRRIAQIILTLDKAIEKTEALIAKYQQIKAGLMHDLFTRGVTADGKLRPPREQAPELYQETPIGWIPKEWDCRKLGKILNESGGYLQTGPFGSQLHAHEYTDDGIPVVMPQDIEDGEIFTHAIARIPESRAQLLARHRVKLGDIIIARRGELSRAAAITQRELGWVCGTGCFLLRLSGSKLDPHFFSYAYRHDIIQRQIEGLAVGSTMPSLNNSVMSSLYFPYLTEDEQHRISDRLETQDKALLSLKYENEKLEKQKAGLMRDLLTGKVRVKMHGQENTI